MLTKQNKDSEEKKEIWVSMESFFKGVRFSGSRVYNDYDTHKKALQRAKDMADGEPFGKKKESYLGVGGWVAKSR